VNLPKYNVYIEYADAKEKPNIRFNLSEEELVRTFVTPYASGNPFWFCGRLLSRSKVAKAIIFWSYESADKLVLPNREEVAGHKDKKFVVDYILRGKVKGVQVCTEKFLSPPGKNE
jgi:hypothetical protein